MADKCQRLALERPYTDLIYQPMLEVMQLLRANGFKTYIVTWSVSPGFRADL